MQPEDLMDLRSYASPEAERRAVQSLDDLLKEIERLEAELVMAVDGLHLLYEVNGGREVVALLLRSEQIQKVSKLRARLGKARTGAEEMELTRDRVRFLRSHYQGLVRADHA